MALERAILNILPSLCATAARLSLYRAVVAQKPPFDRATPSKYLSYIFMLGRAIASAELHLESE